MKNESGLKILDLNIIHSVGLICAAALSFLQILIWMKTTKT